ncbi:MAG: dihydropteroate synthase [Syntrophomonadaceae bacterium]|nr:dihydropteroate synthase [Syntrophomonadaceae bacterium]
MDGHQEQIGSNLPALEGDRWVIPLAHGRSLEMGQRTIIMGILNVTPDSFSDGGRFFDDGRAVAYALEMAEAGADIIDIGGASSRPDSVMATESEEIQRILPVIKQLASHNLILSVDTFRSSVAEAALAQGAHIINDIGNFEMDPDILAVLIKWKAAVVLMHNRLQIRQGEKYQDIVADISAELRQAIATAVNAGLDEERIIIDPGLGFGKTPAENLLLIRRLHDFRSIGRPILLGASRKRFIGHILNLDPRERLEGSLAAAVIGIMNGASIVRVHDVKETKRAAVIADAVRLGHG